MKKNNIRIFPLLVIFAVALSGTVLAASSSWSTVNKRFAPSTGSITSTHYSTYAKTVVSFKYSKDNADYVVTGCNQIGQYTGMDIKNVPSDYNFGEDMMDAYSITTTLPDALTDLENDDPLGTRNEEAEVIALGSINSTTTYSMSVNWNDYRTGADKDNGQWNVNSELSSKGWSDYNVDEYASCTSLAYGKNKGKA